MGLEQSNPMFRRLKKTGRLNDIKIGHYNPLLLWQSSKLIYRYYNLS